MEDRDGSAQRAEVVAVLAHRLRNPLAVLVGYAELLKTRDDPATRREATERLVEAADEVSLAADDVLALLALELEGVAPVFEPVSLGEVTSAALTRAVRRAVGYRFVPESDLESWPVVRGDPTELPRVLADALVAACSFASAPGDVALSPRVTGSTAELHLAAPGPEGAATGVERMFERVARAPANDAVLASGLELYMARRYLELHGGGLRTEPRPDGRLGLVATLPLALEAA